MSALIFKSLWNIYLQRGLGGGRHASLLQRHLGVLLTWAVPGLRAWVSQIKGKHLERSCQHDEGAAGGMIYEER